jgi:guanine nucleotide-binding protein alpha-1 subunit
MRLLPVRHIEALLIAKLVPPNEEEPAHMGKGVDRGTEIGASWRNQEVFVRPGRSWKGAMAGITSHFNDTQNGVAFPSRSTSLDTSGSEIADEPQEVLHACRSDIMQLWNDPTVRNILRLKKVRLEEFPGL